MSWDAPANGAEVTGYTVTASPGPATCTTTGATTCVLGATAGIAYTVTVVAQTAGGDSAASETSNEATPTLPSISDTAPVTDLTMTTDKGMITTAVPGQRIIFLGTGFAAYSTVVITLYSTPALLGTTVTDASGDFAEPVTIPAGTPPGDHIAIAQGVAPDGSPRAMKLDITVAAAAPATGPGSMPVTGAAVTSTLLAGLIFIACGGVLLASARRRRQRTSSA